MKLSDRLELIASMVPACNVVADVGTDHGYLPIALVKNKCCQKAYAMDINKGPLKKAMTNIERAAMSSKVTAILSDGLNQLPEDTDVIVIAGMGGMLVDRILRDAKEKLPKLKGMVLSPHLDEPTVRQTVHELGFVIVKESMVVDQEKYYTVMYCEPGSEVYTSIEYKYGKKLMNERNQVFISCMNQRIQKLSRIKGQLEKNRTQSSIKRIKELEQEISELKEVMNDEQTL